MNRCTSSGVGRGFERDEAPGFFPREQRLAVGAVHRHSFGKAVAEVLLEVLEQNVEDPRDVGVTASPVPFSAPV